MIPNKSYRCIRYSCFQPCFTYGKGNGISFLWLSYKVKVIDVPPMTLVTLYMIILADWARNSPAALEEANSHAVNYFCREYVAGNCGQPLGPEGSLWWTANEKLGPSVIQMQGNKFCQQPDSLQVDLSLVKPTEKSTAWPTSWLQPADTRNRRPSLKPGLHTHRNCEINVCCFKSLCLW